MINPWIIVGILLAIAAAGFGGYQHGYETAVGDVATEANKAKEKAILRANENAVLDAQAAAQTEAARWRKRLKTQEARNALERDLERRKPVPECRAACDLDDTSLGVLQQRIRDANGNPAVDPGKRPDGVSPPAGTDKRGVGGDPKVPR